MSVAQQPEQNSTTNNELQDSYPVMTGRKIFLKASLLSLVFLFIFFFLTAVVISIFAYYKANSFAQQVNSTLPELYETVQRGTSQEPVQTNGMKNILILGLDSVANKPDSPELTDTIIVASINLETGKVNTLSLPRDLWSTAYQTRINALYEYGKERYPENPKQFPTEVISEMTKVEIHHTITLSLSQLGDIVDIVGGVEIDVPQSFTDTEFPREDVDIDTATQDELYETVTFEKGKQIMDGSTVSKYIRSRKSADLNEGTDLARSYRQQQVLTALIEKLQSRAVLTNTDTLAELYNYYQSEFANQLSLTELIATIYKLYPQLENFSLQGHSLSIYPDSENGVITNPPQYLYGGQWVYSVTDLDSFQSEVHSKLEVTK